MGNEKIIKYIDMAAGAIAAIGGVSLLGVTLLAAVQSPLTAPLVAISALGGVGFMGLTIVGAALSFAVALTMFKVSLFKQHDEVTKYASPLLAIAGGVITPVGLSYVYVAARKWNVIKA